MKYTFTVQITGEGDSPKQALLDAVKVLAVDPVEFADDIPKVALPSIQSPEITCAQALRAILLVDAEQYGTLDSLPANPSFWTVAERMAVIAANVLNSISTETNGGEL